MRFGRYIWDKTGMLLLQAACMFFLCLYLFATGNDGVNILLIVICWLLVLTVYLGWDYHHRKKYFDRVFRELEHLDQRYLIGELLPASWRLEDELYREILHSSGKAAIEKLHELEDEAKEYREYMESWIHEVKTPITAMSLICENHRDAYTDRLRMELGKVENEVERVLYFARSERVYQDYVIGEVSLRETALAAIRRNKQYLIAADMSITLMEEDVTVCTDGKWVEFLLNQILGNAIKYRRQDGAGASVAISARTAGSRVSLLVEDNGIGIPAGELGRIFQKGFTGSNGRSRGSATGIGLYLCRKLCDKLGIGITAESEEGVFTRIILTFPDSDHARILQKCNLNETEAHTNAAEKEVHS